MLSFIDNLNIYFLMFFSINIIALGIVLVAGKKMMLSKVIMPTCIIINTTTMMIKDMSIRSLVRNEFILLYVCFFIFAFIMIAKYCMGIYAIINMDYETLEVEIRKKFDENNIENKVIDDSIIFYKDGEKRIKINECFKNSLEIDFRTLRKDKVLYYQMKEWTVQILKGIKSKYYSYDSFIILPIGVAGLVYSIYKLFGK